MTNALHHSLKLCAGGQKCTTTLKRENLSWNGFETPKKLFGAQYIADRLNDDTVAGTSPVGE